MKSPIKMLFGLILCIAGFSPPVLTSAKEFDGMHNTQFSLSQIDCMTVAMPEYQLPITCVSDVGIYAVPIDCSQGDVQRKERFAVTKPSSFDLNLYRRLCWHSHERYYPSIIDTAYLRLQGLS